MIICRLHIKYDYFELGYGIKNIGNKENKEYWNKTKQGITKQTNKTRNKTIYQV